MNKPTRPQYEQAKRDLELFTDRLNQSMQKQVELMSALAEERRLERCHREFVDRNKEIIFAYRIWEQAAKK